MKVSGITDAQNKALTDMLNYGAAAQIYYDYGVIYKPANGATVVDESSLATYDAKNQVTILPSETDSIQHATGKGQCTWKQSVKDSSGNTVDVGSDNWGSRLMLANRFGMHFTFYGIADGMTATMTVEGYSDKTYNLALQKGIDGVEKIGLYYFTTEKDPDGKPNNVLKITDIGKTITVTVKNASGDYCIITDSVASYIARIVNEVEEGTALLPDGTEYANADSLTKEKFGQLKNLLNALNKFSTSASAATEYVLEEVSTNG